MSLPLASAVADMNRASALQRLCVAQAVEVLESCGALDDHAELQ